ncbi:MAG: DegT/DnrJ/EryC1/StrS family aminotransferase [Gracilimonas sp.]
MIKYSNRASYIIYNYLLSNYEGQGYWLIPLNACPIVPITFLTANIPFKLVDIESTTYCIDRKAVSKAIKDPDCIGLLFIHTYGFNYSVEQFFSDIKSKRKDVKIIEDKCLSTPSFEAQAISTHADLTVFSTGYAKYADIGRGGYGFIKESSSYREYPTNYNPQSLKKLTDYYKGCLSQHTCLQIGNSFWLDDKSLSPSEIVQYQEMVLAKRSEVHMHKQELNDIYSEFIPREFWLSVKDQRLDTWRFNIMVPERDELVTEIFDKGLFASTHYQPLDKVLGVEVLGKGTESYALNNHVINLFNDQNFTIDMALELAKLVAGNLKLRRRKYVYSIQ